MRQKGKPISKKQSEKFRKSRKDLSDHRRNLMKEYTDKVAIDEVGNGYTLRFSVWS